MGNKKKQQLNPFQTQDWILLFLHWIWDCGADFTELNASFIERFAAYTESEFQHEDFTHYQVVQIVCYVFVSLDIISVFYTLMFQSRESVFSEPRNQIAFRCFWCWKVVFD